MRKGETGSHIDFGIHVGVTDGSPEALAEVETLASNGFTSFKMFTALGETSLTDKEALALLNAGGRGQRPAHGACRRRKPDR